MKRLRYIIIVQASRLGITRNHTNKFCLEVYVKKNSLMLSNYFAWATNHKGETYFLQLSKIDLLKTKLLIMKMFRKLSYFIFTGFASVVFISSASAQTFNQLVSQDYTTAASITMSDCLKKDSISKNETKKTPTEVINAVKEKLSSMLNIDPNELEVREAIRKTWPNGCLGLAKPDELCTQALVEGWQIVISYQNRTWIYRTDSKGLNIRSEVN